MTASDVIKKLYDENITFKIGGEDIKVQSTDRRSTYVQYNSGRRYGKTTLCRKHYEIYARKANGVSSEFHDEGTEIKPNLREALVLAVKLYPGVLKAKSKDKSRDYKISVVQVISTQNSQFEKIKDEIEEGLRTLYGILEPILVAWQR